MANGLPPLPKAEAGYHLDRYTADQMREFALAAITSSPTPASGGVAGSDDSYPLHGSVWFRDSTQEWVLELEGVINDVAFINRHTQPASTKPEDVAGLPTLYEAATRAPGLSEKWRESAERLEAKAKSETPITRAIFLARAECYRSCADQLDADAQGEREGGNG